MARMMYGFYSQRSRQMEEEDFEFPSFIQIGPNGEEVMCWSDDPHGTEYKWPDKVYVGYFDTTTFKSVQLNPGVKWPDDDDRYDDFSGDYCDPNLNDDEDLD